MSTDRDPLDEARFKKEQAEIEIWKVINKLENELVRPIDNLVFTRSVSGNTIIQIVVNL